MKAFAVLTGLSLAGCASHPPVPSALSFEVAPRERVDVQASTWLNKPRRDGDRFHVAHEDLAWTTAISLGPIYQPSGSCTVTEEGHIQIQAPEVVGIWNCFVRVCREGCMVGHMQLEVSSDATP